jgi:hypothetical protein
VVLNREALLFPQVNTQKSEEKGVSQEIGGKLHLKPQNRFVNIFPPFIHLSSYM